MLSRLPRPKAPKYEGPKSRRLSFAAVVRAMENTFGDNFAKEIAHQKRLFNPSDRALSSKVR